jgi:adenylate cyclase
MVKRFLDRAYRRLGARYPDTLLRIEEQLNYLIVFLAISVLALYVEMSTAEFLRLCLAGALMTLVYTLIYPRVARPPLEPVRAWLAGERSPEETRRAWQACASFPRDMLRRETSARSLGLWVVFVNLAWCFTPPGSSTFRRMRLRSSSSVSSPTSPTRSSSASCSSSASSDRSCLTSRASYPTRRAPSPPACRCGGGCSRPCRRSTCSAGWSRRGSPAASVLVAATVSLLLILLLSDSITTPVGQLRDAAESIGRGDFEVRVPVLTTDETGELTRTFNQMTNGLAERERIREAFGTYVDQEVAEHILREGTDLAGEEVEVTVMFIDVRDFTGFAERQPASKVVGALNRLFELIVPIIHEHAGHVDKFVGDGLLAVFGAPRRQDDHADQALAAALAIDRAVREELEGELEIGIGLNSGKVVAGNVGGAGRLEFSVIGDPVNVAARVEAATRQTGDTILLSEYTKRALNDGEVELAERPDVPLKGKREAVALFAPTRGSGQN